MSEWIQDEERLQAEAIFVPPTDLLTVAARELPHGAFNRLLLELKGEPLTAAVYVKFIEEERNVARF
jgi:hypothetical protein